MCVHACVRLCLLPCVPVLYISLSLCGHLLVTSQQEVVSDKYMKTVRYVCEELIGKGGHFELKAEYIISERVLLCRKRTTKHGHVIVCIRRITSYFVTSMLDYMVSRWHGMLPRRAKYLKQHVTVMSKYLTKRDTVTSKYPTNRYVASQ